ncbi:hypothetical protein [Amycolatopsis sp. MtRt-6]|uniref:DUF6923 family protein n=1 Tax=Amycolatopsis sp. MtRt-6 TaxID=2792782 RepID=UPI001A8E6E53|nr:hypothetical protein [Amycolatopsis sp. MtRt-6]
MTGTRLRWAAVAGAAVAVSALPAVTGGLAEAREPGGCTVLQAENEREGAPTTLRLLTLPGGVTQRVTRAGYRLNALGYSAAQDVVYGVADGTRTGRYHGAHAVRIDAGGTVTDLGVLGRAGPRSPVWSPATGATAGAVDGDRWYVRQGSDLYTVDIERASRDYGRVVHRTALRPVSLAVGVDDFAFDPADGLLYGVSATSRGAGSVVTLDPSSGEVAVVPGLRFPEGGAYGSVVLAPGTIYATANREGRRSVTYRLPRDGSGQAAEVVSGPALASGDAAGCVTEPPSLSPPPWTPPGQSSPPPWTPPGQSSPPPWTPPGQSSPPPSTPPGQSSPPQPPPPPRTEQPPAPPAPEPSPPPPPVEQQPVVVPPSPAPRPTPAPVVTPTPPTSAPPAPPPTTPRARPEKEPEPVAQDAGRRTEEKRRWGLAALLLVLGGGAAVAHRRRHR